MLFVQSSIFEIGLWIVCLRHIHRVFYHQAFVKDFVTLMASWTQLRRPLKDLGDFYRSSHDAFVSADHLIQLLEQNPTVKDHPNACNLEVCEGEIIFNNVDFSYHSHSETLKGLTLHVPARNTVALIGGSGVGKTTILRLLVRFYDVTEGVISIDGQDIRKVKLSSLRKNVWFVSQVYGPLILLMSGTLYLR